MTNTEKNIRIAELLGYEKRFLHWGGDTLLRFHKNGLCVREGRGEAWQPDYTENWNSLMPLCIEHDVFVTESVEFEHTNLAYDASCNGNFIKTSSNPQTALVDCLIAVLESKEQGNA